MSSWNVLPTEAQLTVLDEVIAELRAVKNKLIDKTYWYRLSPETTGNEVNNIYNALDANLTALRAIRAKFKVETVTTTKVVRV